MAIRLALRTTSEYSLLHFELGKEPLDTGELKKLELPAEVLSRRHLGLILSGRGPVWLYVYLASLAHPFAWLATYDPRLNGAVVVARHVPGAPEIGSLIAVETPDLGQT